MSAQILELRLPPGSEEEIAGEYELHPGLTPEAAASQLPLAGRQHLSPMAAAFEALHRGLSEDLEMTGLRRVRLYLKSAAAARLEGGPAPEAATAGVALPALAAGPQWSSLLADLLRAQALYPGGRDTRLPRRFTPLAGIVAPLRHLLGKIREQAHRQPRFATAILGPLEDADPDRQLDPFGQTRRLLQRFLSRQDWRERDVLHLILDFIQQSPSLYGENLLSLWLALKTMQDQDPAAYTRVIAALINEGRGYLGELPRWRHLCGLRASAASGQWEPADTFRVIQGMAGLLGLEPEDLPALSSPAAAATISWETLKETAVQKWGESSAWKPFEKASLFLAAELFPDNPGHRRFLRSLLENEEPYRQLLATAYSPLDRQLAQLDRIVTAHNGHPANIETRVHYRPEEAAELLRVFFLRPDPVEAIIDRERKKDIYHTLQGLKGQALLPQVLHECQNIFRYITPEALKRVAAGLEVPTAEIVRVIASYKEFTVDPTGQITLYVCKGTACFLRGQPHLSRALTSRLGVEEGRVSSEGVQFLERDCFGTCHLAPVIKVGHTFIPALKPEEIPDVIAKLLKGRSFANRTDFFKAVRDSLAEVDQVELRRSFKIQATYQLSAAPEEIEGLAINGLGEIRALPDGKLLGSLADRSYSFSYLDAAGNPEHGTLVTDDDDFLVGAVNIPDPEVQTGLRLTLRPRVFLKDGQVYLEGRGPALGAYHSSSIALKKPDGSFASLVLAEENRQSPPEEIRGLTTAVKRPVPPEFVARQDRVLLGFVEGVNPESIDSYLEKGGYQALKKVLGYGQAEKRWPPEAIVREILAANLRGRGGAGFPTGVKWQAMLAARPQVEDGDEVAAPLKLLVANGDEGDPGAFMDRTLIQERPHQVLEGMLIAALATGCRYGVIYVRKEYEDAVQRLENAVFAARRYGFLGQTVMGVPDFDFDVEIRLGAGAFVAGEKRAIMRAIAGKAAEPDLKAVSNVRRGLWGKPTLLNNVETLANVPLIVSRGGAWFRDQGYEATGGTKIFSVAGIVNHTGLVEVRFGRTLRDVLHIAGGVQEDKKLAGVQIGGPSGAILSLTGIRAYLLDAPLDFDVFNRVGAMIGSGGLVFLGEDDDVVRLARHFTEWLADESCGQCPVCLNGLVSLGATLDRILKGDGNSLDIHALWGKADIIRAGSNCGLGQTASNPVTSSLRFFPVAYLHYLLDNPLLDTLELFLSLEALHLITREGSSPAAATESGRVAFFLKKGLIRFIVEELEKRERFRPGVESRPRRFLKLLDLSRSQVGWLGLRMEYAPETVAQHPYRMVGGLASRGEADLGL
jgi:NADH:ubiquinone oxidoreductase subunit F (NADH-binding)/NADH:ubiquinone oxidoreductase subunit E